MKTNTKQAQKATRKGKTASRKQAASSLRINLFLSRAGVASRRGADALIEKGSVKVNGKVLKEPGMKVQPDKDTIEVKQKSGTWTSLSLQEEKIIYALYKPRGYVTSMRKQGKSPIVKKLVPQSPRVFPVGRLDKESEGLLLLTNDGELAHMLTHPKTHIEKSYRVHCTIPGRYTEDTLKSHLGRVAKGVRIDGRKTLSAKIILVKYLRQNMVELLITLREGRNRQIRKMLGTIHLEVVRLIRTKIGNLDVDKLGLEHGAYVRVKESDIL